MKRERIASTPEEEHFTEPALQIEEPDPGPFQVPAEYLTHLQASGRAKRTIREISNPLNRWLGHRRAFHSFWLWGLFCFCGLLWKPVFLIGIGGLLHVIADCATVSGVRGFSPWSEKLFVMFRRSWRIKSGSPHEIIVLLIFGVIAWAGGYMGAVGGIQALIGHITGAPKIMF